MATLLIVEDDKQTNEAICEYLKSAGHKLVSAYDGASALQLFDQEAIDLVVLDIMLPKVTGLGVLHEIRKTSACQPSVNCRIGLTVEEAAAYTGIGRNTLRQLVSWGKIPVLKIGRKMIIRADVIDRFMEINQGVDLLNQNQVRCAD